jgi:hypothetical protein
MATNKRNEKIKGNAGLLKGVKITASASTSPAPTRMGNSQSMIGATPRVSGGISSAGGRNVAPIYKPAMERAKTLEKNVSTVSKKLNQ